MSPNEGYDVLPKKYFDVEILREELSQIGVSTRDWKGLYEGLLRNISRMKDKWDVVRYIYRFINTRYDHITATRVTWKITKRFSILFERGRYVDFYLPTLTGVELFEELINPNTGEGYSKAKTGQKVQLTLTSAFSRVQGVRV